MADDFSDFAPVSDNSGQTEDFSDFQLIPSTTPAILFQPDTSGSRRLNARFNNPGALGLSDLGRAYGATESGVYDTGHPFAAFPTPEAGAAAQFALWQNKQHYLNHTLKDAITNWIGPGEHGEAEYISQKTGIPLNQVITDEFLRSPHGIRLAQAQAEYEGQNVLTVDQWQRAQDWAYNRGRAAINQQTIQPVNAPAPQEDFSDFQTVQASPPRAELVANPPATPQGRAVSPLYPTRAIPSQDFGDTKVMLGEPQSPPYVAGEPLAIQTGQPKASVQPAPGPLNARLKGVTDFGRQVAGNAVESAGQIQQGEARSYLDQAKPMPPIFPEPADVTAARAQRDKAYEQSQLAEGQKNKFLGQDIKPDYAAQESAAGKVGEFVGNMAPPVAASMAGPAGIALASGMMGAQAHTQIYDEAIKRGATEAQANDLADKAAKVALVVGATLGASGIHVPAENVIARIIARGGLTGTIQGEAQAIQQEFINEDFIKAGFQPVGTEEQGVTEAGLTGFGMGAVAGGLHAAFEKAPTRPQEPPVAESATVTPPEPQTQPQTAPEAKPVPVTPEPEPQPAPEPGPLAAEIQARTGAPPPEPVSPAEADAQARNEALYNQLKKETSEPEQPETSQAPVQATQENARPQSQEAAQPPPVPARTAQQIKDKTDYEAALRAQLSDQAQEASAQGQTSLLKTISDNGGLPTPARLKNLAAKGEVLTGEMARVYDAWKSLSADDKAWLKKQGTGYTDIFTNDAKGLDTMNSDLAQTPGANFESPAEMLEQVEEAIAKAKQRQEHYTEFYSGLPVPKLSITQRTAISQGLRAFKGGEDYLNDYPETRPLALAERRLPSYAQKFSSDTLEPELRRQSEKASKSVRAEFEAWNKAEQNGLPLPQVSPQAAKLINAAKDTFQGMGAIMKRQGTLVQDSKGNIRPARIIGRSFFPRSPNQNMMDIWKYRDTNEINPVTGNRYADDFNRVVQESLAAGELNVNGQPPLLPREEFINRFINAHVSEQTSNAHFANQERARELNLPLRFNDYSLETALRYVNRGIENLAQHEAVGQKIGKVEDLFDKTIKAVETSNRIPPDTKRFIVDRLRSERDAVYNQWARGEFRTAVGKTLQTATGLYVGNPASSFKYLVTGQMQNIAFNGPVRFLRTLVGSAFHPSSITKAFRSADDANIFRSQLRNVINDLNPQQGASAKFTQFVLEHFGHNTADAWNRVTGMLQTRLMLADFNRWYGKSSQTPWARQLYGIIRASGIRDLNALKAENGTGPLTEEFIRQRAMDVHGNYTLSQSPSWMQSPWARPFFQFSRWGQNAARMYTKEYLMPLAKAANPRNNDPAGFAYHFARNLAVLGVGAGVSGEAIQAFRTYVLGRDPDDPTWNEIGSSLMKGNYGQFLQRLFSRGGTDLLLGGLLGSFGDIAQLGQSITNPAGVKNFHNPLIAPAMGIPTAIGTFLLGWAGETNNFTKLAPPSPKLWQNLLDSESALRVARQAGLTLAGRTGLPVPGAQDYAARNTLAWTRQREQMFARDDPVFANKLSQLGNRSSQSAGRTPFDPVHDKIQSALLTGDAAGAKQAARDWLAQFPVAQRPDRLKALQSSIRESQPLKPGGSISATSQNALIRWARGNLPPEEVTRMFDLARVYARTAGAAGFPIAHP